MTALRSRAFLKLPLESKIHFQTQMTCRLFTRTRMICFQALAPIIKYAKISFPSSFCPPPLFLAKISGLGDKTYNWVALRRKRLFGVCEPYFYTSKNISPFKAGKWAVKFFSLFLIASLVIVLFSRKYSLESSVLFGQKDVSVMNKSDLGMGAPGVVLIETDANGKFKRTVPFMDLNGGRLSYLRNDYLYFHLSLPWQRKYTYLKLSNEFSKDFIFSFQKLGEAVGVLDSCLKQSSGLRYYRTDLYVKKLKSNPSFQFWGEPQKIASHSFSVDMDQLKSSEPKCLRAYNLPPGHLFSAKRIDLTNSFYKNNLDNK